MIIQRSRSVISWSAAWPDFFFISLHNRVLRLLYHTLSTLISLPISSDFCCHRASFLCWFLYWFILLSYISGCSLSHSTILSSSSAVRFDETFIFRFFLSWGSTSDNSESVFDSCTTCLGDWLWLALPDGCWEFASSWSLRPATISYCCLPLESGRPTSSVFVATLRLGFLRLALFLGGIVSILYFNSCRAVHNSVSSKTKKYCRYQPAIYRHAEDAQQVAQRRQEGGRIVAMDAQGLPWSPNGGTVVATVIAQCTLLVGQRRHNGRTREAEASPISGTIFSNITHLVYANHWPTIVRPFCNPGDPWASALPPVSDLSATILLGNLCATVLNMSKTSRRPWRPLRCLSILCATIERPRRPFCLLCASNEDLTSFMVAQGRQKGRSPCVKGVLNVTESRSRKICIKNHLIALMFDRHPLLTYSPICE